MAAWSWRPRYSAGPSVEFARIWSAAAHSVRRTYARSVVFIAVSHSYESPEI